MSQLSFATLFVKHEFYIIFNTPLQIRPKKALKTRENKNVWDPVPCIY